MSRYPADYSSSRYTADYSSSRRSSDPRRPSPYISRNAQELYGIGLYSTSGRSSRADPMLLSQPMEPPTARTGTRYVERPSTSSYYSSTGSSSHAHRGSGSDPFYYGSSTWSSTPGSGSTRSSRLPSASSSVYRDPYYVGHGWEASPSARTSSSTGTRRRSGSEAPQYLPNRRPSYYEVREPSRDLYSSTSGQREYYSGTGTTTSYYPGGYTATRPSERRPWH